MGLGRRLYRVRPLPALLLSAPGILVCAWYLLDAWSGLGAYRRLAAPKRALGLEELQLALHDALYRDLRRMSLPDEPRRRQLPRYHFTLENDALERLEEGARHPERRPYVPAKLERGGEILPVELRLRGTQPWHVLGPKRSLKVRVSGKDSIDGQKVLNLVHDPTPMVVGEAVVSELLRAEGVLAPEVAFARVGLNRADLGVYRLQAQADEGLLRSSRRYPGDLFSGNLGNLGNVSGQAEALALWRDPRSWKKVATLEGRKKDYGAIERLVAAVSGATGRDFAAFAREEIDLERFAILEAIEIAFGIDERDARGNQKIFFDAYRGRYEPVAWALRGFRHREAFDLVESPLSLRLKSVPGYLSLRAAALFRLLTGPASPNEVRDRAMRRLKRLLPELVSDPNWSAYKLLPDVDGFLRRMLRPMDVRRLGLVFESEMATYAARHRFLLALLKRNPLSIALETGAARRSIALAVEGQAGVSLEVIRLELACGGPFRLMRAGREVTGVFADGAFALDPPLALEPGFALKKGEMESALGVEAVPLGVIYRFEVEAACDPEAVVAEAVHRATGAHLVLRSGPRNQGTEPERLGPDAVPAFAHGEVSPHPWSLEAVAAPSEVRLGPGEVHIDTSRTFFGAVSVAAGTRLLMGPGVGLLFRGPVHFEGRLGAPIEVVAALEKPFGGIALVGPRTQGSRLRHVVVRGGSRPHFGALELPGTLDIHDTRDIELEDVHLQNCREADGLHAIYVDGLVADHLEVKEVSEDALDLEFVRATLSGLTCRGAGEECLDLMGSKVQLGDSFLAGAEDNAISAGEGSRLKIVDSLVANGRTGILAKNGAEVELLGSVVYRAQIALRVERPATYYPEPSRIQADGLFVVECAQERSVPESGPSEIAVAWLQRRLPQGGGLGHLRRDVLQIDSWADLDRALGRAP